VAFSVDVEGQERLVVVAEAERRRMAARRAQPGKRAVVSERGQAASLRQPVAEGRDRSVPLSFDPEPVFQAIRESVARHFEAVVSALVLIRSGTIHKTTSGKLQRRKVKAAFLEATLEVIAEKRFFPGSTGA
jgi:acyl-CoA synthetase (AMP-forming)/AMP-acid ligase II